MVTREPGPRLLHRPVEDQPPLIEEEHAVAERERQRRALLREHHRGAALARELARAGWHCVLLARREERLRALASEIGGEYEVCDVASRADVDEVSARIIRRHSQIALLVNNAGIPGRASFLEIEPARLEQVTHVNYLGGVWSLRAFLPALERAPRAHVVNVVSVAGTVAAGTGGPYSAAKHAQLAFSRAIAAELRPRGIRVHAILPGFVETEGFPQRGRMRSRLARRIVIEPDQVAEAIVDAIARNRAEVWVPGWYRPAGLAQALAPGFIGRLRGGRRRGPYEGETRDT